MCEPVLVAYAAPVTGKLVRLWMLGETIGRLAIHPILFEPPGSGYSITHSLTGFRVTSFHSLEAARRFCYELQDLDWEFIDPDNIPLPTRRGVLSAFNRRGVVYQPPPLPDPSHSRACLQWSEC